MSRSYKKTPYAGDHKGKAKKRIANHKVRRNLNQDNTLLFLLENIRNFINLIISAILVGFILGKNIGRMNVIVITIGNIALKMFLNPIKKMLIANGVNGIATNNLF